ncbi:hypothetical protein M514_01312 [Trichuris suis]|uniref:Uncharacterized protein n=1 Tax=Trichuris suis TaxID=68888 RepID=A0A085NS30_9BILA|nr:hypothetical protein M513_01312 [Trichuris suis]KFD72276.1 hypothetical protein M514_01312 [Trichuris suis]
MKTSTSVIIFFKAKKRTNGRLTGNLYSRQRNFETGGLPWDQVGQAKRSFWLFQFAKCKAGRSNGPVARTPSERTGQQQMRSVVNIGVAQGQIIFPEEAVHQPLQLLTVSASQ